MDFNNKLLRSIPKVDDMLLHPLVAGFACHATAATAVREVLEGLRREILSGTRSSLPDIDIIALRIAERIRAVSTPNLRRLINATGIVLHTNLGRAPLAKSAVDAVRAVAEGYSTLEYDLVTGERGSRHSHVEGLLTRLTGAEAAMAVNNNASAVLLALSAVTSGKEVVVSRGELVEIGGAFRIPDVMERSGAILREAGTTNRTRLSDYESAIEPEKTGGLFKAHTSNYKIIGFTEEVSIGDMSALGRKYSLPVIHDLGSGSLIPPARYGLAGEPYVGESLAAGADIVTFSGDKLLGGPQAGIIVGKAKYIAALKKHPLARAIRIDKLTLAALEATLRLYLDPDTALAEIPTLRMLAAGPDTLQPKAEQLHLMLKPIFGQVAVTDTAGQVGGGSFPGILLPSSAVEISPLAISVDELERRLRESDIPIIGRIYHDKYLLDLRTIEEEDFDYIAATLNRILEKGA